MKTCHKLNEIVSLLTCVVLDEGPGARHHQASQALGEGAQFWLGFATFAFGILKLAALEFAALETWRIARATTISFDLLAVTALVLGGALMLTAGALAGRKLGREESPDT